MRILLCNWYSRYGNVYYLTTAIEISACCLFAWRRFSQSRPTPVTHSQLSSFFQLSDNVAWLFFYYFLIWRWFISLLLKNIKALRKILLQAFCDVWVFGIIFSSPRKTFLPFRKMKGKTPTIATSPFVSCTTILENKIKSEAAKGSRKEKQWINNWSLCNNGRLCVYVVCSHFIHTAKSRRHKNYHIYWK